MLIGGIIAMSLTLSTTAINDDIDDDIDDEIGPPRAMLLLSSYGYLQPPRIIGTTGELSTSMDFNNEVRGSCAVTHKNKQLIFGGANAEFVWQMRTGVDW